VSNFCSQGAQKNAPSYSQCPLSLCFQAESTALRLHRAYVRTSETMPEASAIRSRNGSEDPQASQSRELCYRSQSTAVDGPLNPMVRTTQDSETANDRRRIPRFRVRAPLTVIAGDREIPAYTRDLSNRGVYFYLASDDGGARGPAILLKGSSTRTLNSWSSCLRRSRFRPFAGFDVTGEHYARKSPR
jgi:hypothetical protein